MTTPKAKLAGLALIAALCAGFTLGLTACTDERARTGAETPPAEADFNAGFAAYKRGDYATALREWRPLAEQAVAYAEYNLGVMYEKGRGVTQDYAEAVKWYRKAAEQGVAEAQTNLGLLYEQGHGVSQDYAEAMRLYRKAAEQGDGEAQFNLGLMYSKGQGVPQDYAEAVKWYRKAADRLPIFDTHMHYSREAWEPYGPSRIFGTLDAAGVARALVSSTPDEGTLRLYRHGKDRIVPILRPYHGDVTRGNWLGEPGVLAYLEERLRRGIYRGIGEIHLIDDIDVRGALITRVVALAVARDIVLHVHCGAGPVRALFAIDSKVKVLWAHAGMRTPPEVVGELLERYPRLSMEVSGRAAVIAPGGRLNGAWRALFLRHPDRFMIGTDTYVNGQWDAYGALVEEHRQWLAQLPRDVAKAIAYGNAVGRFGAGGRTKLRD